MLGCQGTDRLQGHHLCHGCHQRWLKQNVLVGLTRQLGAKILMNVARLSFPPGHAEVGNTEKGGQCDFYVESEEPVQ